MKYSVVTTVYNDSKSICRYLNEILNQQNVPQEIVIADGGSSDETVEIIKRYAENSKVPIRVICGERLNIAEGFNEAIKNATSDIVGITAVGNRYPDDFFEKLCGELQKDQSLDAVYSLIRGYDDTQFSKLYNKTFIGKGMKLAYPTNHGVLIKKDIVEELGYFYEKFKYAGEDYELFQRFLAEGKQSKCLVDTELQWETPRTFKEYCKQTRVYLVGNMQCCDNVLLLKMMSKKLIYVVTCIVAFFFSFFDGTRKFFWLWVIFLLLLGFKDCIRVGFDGVMLRNHKILLEVYYFFKEIKYLSSSNKVILERRLKKIYK